MTAELVGESPDNLVHEVPLEGGSEAVLIPTEDFSIFEGYVNDLDDPYQRESLAEFEVWYQEECTNLYETKTPLAKEVKSKIRINGEEFDVIPEDRAKEIRRNHEGNHANLINLIVNTISNPDYFIEEDLTSQFYEDAVTVAVEKVLSSEFQMYQYAVSNEIKPSLFEMLKNGKDPLNQQIPEFELARNEANYWTFLKLEKARGEGNMQPFIELSPPPILTKEAVARGYGENGMLTVSYPEYDEIGNYIGEKVLQGWGSELGVDFFSSALNEVGIENDAKTDVEVLNLSRTMSANELEEFLDIVLNKTDTNFSKDAALVAERYKEEAKTLLGEVVESTKRAALELLVESDDILKNGNEVEPVVGQELENMMVNLAIVQTVLTEKLAKYSDGLDGVVDQSHGSFIRQYYEERREQILVGLERGELELGLVGCGINESIGQKNGGFYQNVGLLGQFGSGGINSIYLPYFIYRIPDGKYRPDVSESCGNKGCDSRWYINIKNPSTWLEKCPACKKPIKRC